jgi:hypothetical protein
MSDLLQVSFQRARFLYIQKLRGLQDFTRYTTIDVILYKVNDLKIELQ